jgi:aryl-alcohol dehydrogenase
MNSMAAHEGSSLLVLGAGSVGLAGVLGGVVQGCSTIIVVEPHASRRALALELGATHALDPAAGELAEQVRAIVPIGAQYVFDTTGIPAVIEASLGAMAPHAALGLVGVPTDPTAAIGLSLMQAMIIGIKIYGIIEGDAVPDEFIPRLAALHSEGRFPFDKMITKFPFDQINEAIEGQHKGEVVKAVLVHD